MSDPFAAIRPFNDGEVRPAVERLLHSDEFLAAILRLRFGEWILPLAAPLRPLLRLYLRSQLGSQRGEGGGVEQFQHLIKVYMDRMIEESTRGFTVSGLEALNARQAYLFISNHRDIAMDPAFTNYALHQSGRNTLRIAIGDNLLTEQWVADLMRLNKSFIVQRSVSSRREFFAASQLLSQYIRHSIQTDCVPVWIAQREGRAKDGIDRTEPAVIKMLSLSRDKQTEGFAEHMAGLRIVPVAISYELDPCDAMKATELWARATQGSYQKAAQEDVASIGRGISGNKGRVHVSFGAPLGSDYENAHAVAEALDRQILQSFRLHPTNLWAYERLYGAIDTQGLNIAEGSCSEAEFQARIDCLDPAVRPYALAGYANALKQALELPRAS